MTVFLVVVSIASGVFMQALRTQRNITNLSESLNNISLALERMSREMRFAFGFPQTIDSNQITFINASGRTVTYKLNGKVIERHLLGEGAEAITAEDVYVSNLRFIRNGGTKSPRITIVAEVTANDSPIQLQTTISSRILTDQ